jgi:integrase
MINRRRLVQQATRAEALAVLETLRTELQVQDAAPAQTPLPAPVPTSPETLGDFAASWLAVKTGRRDLAPSTANRYATALDHLSERLCGTPLLAVSRREIQDWMTAGRKKYAAQTVNGWLRVLRACLSDAVADGKIAQNPAALVKALRVEVDLEETNSLPPGELRAVLDALRARDSVIHAIAWTQALTGLRWGEASALKWDDYEEEASVLRVRRSVCERKLRPLTKTGKARIVGVPQVLADVLRAHRELLVREEHPGLRSGLMFPTLRGTPLSSGRISDELQAACKSAGITTRFTSHGFRRSLTDLLRSAQVDPVVAAGLTGHETERMRKHYSTVRAAEAVDASERVARLVQPSLQSAAQSTLQSADPGHEKSQPQTSL